MHSPQGPLVVRVDKITPRTRPGHVVPFGYIPGGPGCGPTLTVRPTPGVRIAEISTDLGQLSVRDPSAVDIEVLRWALNGGHLGFFSRRRVSRWLAVNDDGRPDRPTVILEHATRTWSATVLWPTDRVYAIGNVALDIHEVNPRNSRTTQSPVYEFQ